MAQSQSARRGRRKGRLRQPRAAPAQVEVAQRLVLERRVAGGDEVLEAVVAHPPLGERERPQRGVAREDLGEGDGRVVLRARGFRDRGTSVRAKADARGPGRAGLPPGCAACARRIAPRRGAGRCAVRFQAGRTW